MSIDVYFIFPNPQDHGAYNVTRRVNVNVVPVSPVINAIDAPTIIMISVLPDVNHADALWPVVWTMSRDANPIVEIVIARKTSRVISATGKYEEVNNVSRFRLIFRSKRVYQMCSNKIPLLYSLNRNNLILNNLISKLYVNQLLRKILNFSPLRTIFNDVRMTYVTFFFTHGDLR